MPAFLSDPPPTLYLMLFAAVLASGVILTRTRNRRSITIFAVSATLLGLVYLADRLSESPREASVREILEMVESATRHDPDGFVKHIAETFQYTDESGQTKTVTRAQVRNAGFWNLLRQHGVRVAAWDFSRADVTEPDANSIEIGFLAKGEEISSGKQVPMYFRATFTRQPDGTMKLTRLAPYDAVKRANERKSLPGFP